MLRRSENIQESNNLHQEIAEGTGLGGEHVANSQVGGSSPLLRVLRRMPAQVEGRRSNLGVEAS